MIQVRQLLKQYPRRDTAALRHIDLDISSGRVTAIVGPNGAGKSTLMRILLGLTRPDAGTVTIDGRSPIADRTCRERIGYMPQIARFPERQSARDVLALLGTLRGGDVTAASWFINEFGLRPSLDKPLGTLSGGTRQRVNAMLALAFKPEVLLLDEPTAGLDPSASATLKDCILSERADGRTILVTSHVMSDLEELADDIVLLVEGTVRFTGTVRQLVESTSQRNLERALASLQCWSPAA